MISTVARQHYQAVCNILTNQTMALFQPKFVASAGGGLDNKLRWSTSDCAVGQVWGEE